ncbi:HAD family hydrolase [Gloeocapsopsis sp. IPPAS B-1203]|uniref:HAD family hydrolase n=1 Tax=Gloeocapsopsis sp. IPPAS B-1203 TaxID=2049454 RepID=UPI0025A2F26D|nr:HAD family hydrolase [Gloeocapsopsis sp. IPPAS B-1203]
MNDTFMFDADRFGAEQDYSIVYRWLGGTLQSNTVNELIQAAYTYLDKRYPDANYRESFPSLRDALLAVSGRITTDDELEILIQTFSYHELGSVPALYSEALRKLAQRFCLGLVADIWAPKTLWINELNRSDVLNLFEIATFSSDSGIVKPSPLAFLNTLKQMKADPDNALVIGDSVRRDLGGAVAAGLPCLLVGGATHPSAYGASSNLLELVDTYC